MILTCEWPSCSREYKTFPAYADRRDHHFCSKTCSGLFHRIKTTHPCLDCGKPISDAQGCGKFCSKACWHHFCVTRDHPERAVVTHAGYMFYTAGPNRMRLVHRVLMEQYLGRPLRRSEDIHHLNGIRTDNRIANLLVCSRREHAAFHPRKHPHV